MIRYLLFYTSADDVLEKVPIHAPAHGAYWREKHAQGQVLMIGPYPDASGALGIFPSRAAAEEFARSDPFVLNQVVTDWRIQEWDEAVADL
jgi:uncharacterized protein YciI